MPPIPDPMIPSHQDRLADANPPVFASASMIDERSAASPMVLTHKFFTHIGWKMCEIQTNPITIVPALGLGWEIEFEGFNERDTAQFNKNTLAQWGIWAYGSLHF